MEAVKGNKVYTVDETTKGRYQNDGFDIYQNGEVIAHGKSKTVPYAKYAALLEENKALKAENEEMKQSLQATASEEKAKTK